MIINSQWKVTQGTIFSCAKAMGIEQSVLGLIITARCDLEHSKSSLVNYVPILSFEQWLDLYGNRLIINDVRMQILASFKQCIADLGEAKTLVDAFPITDILTKFEGLGFDKSKPKPYAKFVECGKNVLTITDPEFRIEEAPEDIKKRFCRLSEKLHKDLVENRIADLHFLPATTPDECCLGYVAMLREIRFLNAEIAAELSKGLEYHQYIELVSELGADSSQLALTDESDFGMCVGELVSPYIELLMQRLTTVFSRIGVPDYDRSLLDEMATHTNKKVRL